MDILKPDLKDMVEIISFKTQWHICGMYKIHLERPWRNLKDMSIVFQKWNTTRSCVLGDKNRHTVKTFLTEKHGLKSHRLAV